MGLDINYRPFTQSMAKTYNWCPMKYYYEYVKCLVTIFINFPFIIGNGTHVGVQSLLKHKNLKRALKESQLEMDKKKAEYEKNMTMSALGDQDYIHQCLNVEGMITNYYLFREDFIKQVKVLFLERVIRHPQIFTKNFQLTIKVDAIIKLKNDLLLYELKTTRSPSHDSIMAYLGQFIVYYMVTKLKYSLNGVYLDAIKKPGIRIGKKESPEDFLVRLGEVYKSEENYYFDIFKPSPSQMEQYKTFMLDTLSRINLSEKFNLWPHNRYMCRVFGNCSYLLLCDNGENEMTMRRYKQKTSINEELEED